VRFIWNKDWMLEVPYYYPSLEGESEFYEDLTKTIEVSEDLYKEYLDAYDAVKKAQDLLDVIENKFHALVRAKEAIANEIKFKKEQKELNKRRELRNIEKRARRIARAATRLLEGEKNEIKN